MPRSIPRRRKSARRRSRSAPRGRAAASAIRVWRPGGIRAWPEASSATVPIQIGAHARAQLRYLLDRISADGERSQAEIAGGARGTPARIFALGGDQPDLDGDAAAAEGGNAHAETVADLQRLDQILTQIEVDPHVVEIDQRHQRYARRNVFAGLDVALVDLRSYRRVNSHLIDDRLRGLDVGDGLADIRLRDLVLLFRITVDVLIVGRLGLVHGTLAFVQGIGRLVEPGDRGIPMLSQLADPVIGLLRQDHARLRPLQLGLARGDHLRAGADIDVGELRLGNDLGGQ